MAKEADVIRSEALATYQRIRNVRNYADVPIRAKAGENPTVLGVIAAYKASENYRPRRDNFAGQFTDEDLVWFYNHLNSDQRSGTSNQVTELTPAQKRELLYTLYRYWNSA